nr:hypothetical protein [Oscillospiraceae bacterium]
MILFSLILGIGAWVFAVLAGVKKSTAWMYASFCACLVAALLPFYELRRYLYSGDYGGAEDIIGGILFGELTLIGVTILLNAAALFRIRK